MVLSALLKCAKSNKGHAVLFIQLNNPLLANPDATVKTKRPIRKCAMYYPVMGKIMSSQQSTAVVQMLRRPSC